MTINLCIHNTGNNCLTYAITQIIFTKTCIYKSMYSTRLLSMVVVQHIPRYTYCQHLNDLSNLSIIIVGALTI